MASVDRRQFLRAAAAAGLFAPSLESVAEALGHGHHLDAPALPLSPGDYPLQAVALERVRIADGFWRPRMEVNRDVSLKVCFERFAGGGGFNASKLIEAAAYMLQERPDPDLEAYVENRIDGLVTSLQRRAQRPEQSVRVSGHVLEAATAYARATGKLKLLDAVVDLASQMDRVYGPGRESYISGHEGLKIGLVALYRETGDERYWRLAKFFADERGKEDYPRTGEYALDRTYAQDHQPVVEQSEAVGHCVRATFLYIAMTDIAALTGDPAYRRAVHRIWKDQTHFKTYLTGGIGSVRFHEQYGEAYELPNLSAWNETCAAYGNAVWSHRLALLEKDARFVDVMERVLYNALLVGVSLGGDRFFYQNPLKSFGDYRRFERINVPCCPPNVVRLLASLAGYVYATEPTGAVYVNLFVESDADIDVGGVPVRLGQETRYPWDGRIRLTVAPEHPVAFPLHVRVPGWARGEVMPGDLYRFADRDPRPTVLRVNGQATSVATERGYVSLERTWRAGDVVELELPMPVRHVLAHGSVRDDLGRVALQRGPLVYCAEWPDNEGRALNLVVPEGATLGSEFRPDLLGGVQVIRGGVREIETDSRGVRAATRPHELVAIPYYAWANRGMGEMAVWMARGSGKAWLPPLPPAPVARVTTSGGVEKVWTGYNDQNDDLASIHDGREPINSADQSHRFFRMRPPVGERAWLEYHLEAPTTVSFSRVYFFDDKRFCRLPESWRLYVLDGEAWRAVADAAALGVTRDTWSSVAFDPFTTRALRLEVEPRTVAYKAGEIGPPAAMFLDEDIAWREFGVIEWQIG